MMAPGLADPLPSYSHSAGQPGGGGKGEGRAHGSKGGGRVSTERGGRVNRA